jgi:hypothetical protein
MQTKLFEIRDRQTMIPVMATKMTPEDEPQRYLLARAGYGRTREEQAKYVIVTKLAGDCFASNYDPYGWRDGGRTMNQAHIHISRNFDALETGSVIDVEFILGETDTPKTSERLSA